MKSSKLTTKYQTTIPKELRDILHLKPGDAITCPLRKWHITIRKTKNFDEASIQPFRSTLSEWESNMTKKITNIYKTYDVVVVPFPFTDIIN